MSSLRRQRSSRANGSLSRGPVTPEGKQRSSQNAISHGLLAACIVLPGESLEGFQAVLEQHLERFAPFDAIEQGMIEEMAAAHWRMRRAWSVETKLLTDAIAKQAGPDNRSRIAGAFQQLAATPELALILRYETRLHMMYQRALHNILVLREKVPPPHAPAPNGPQLVVTPPLTGESPTHTAPVSPVAPPDVATPLKPAAKAAAQLATPSRVVVMPSEPNPISERPTGPRERRRLWWRKRKPAAGRGMNRAMAA